MIELPLTIAGGPACREAAAWFIPGDDAQTWLAEIARWDVAHSQLQVFVLPASRRQRTPVGILIVCVAAEKPQPSPRCLPYGCLAQRFYLPVEAHLQPDVSAEELANLLDAERTYVFHPGAGLCAFDPGEALTVADLLQPPTRRERLWNRARPGVTFARRLLSLTPEATLTFEQVLEQGRGDIGSQASDLAGLPPSPDEPAPNPLAQVGRHAQRLLAGFVAWLTRFAPATASQPTWVNRLQDWANRKLGLVNDAWNRHRHKEILRLLRQLKNDPDRGLKYAIPLSGGAHRGVAQGGNQLTARDVNFNLGQLGGGGVASFWDLPEQYRQQLIEQYRLLANRELQLGRHRRAAYIFATLLGDLEAAASALTQGCHWREAAVLYREKLNRPLDAANCLERGGLWTEAVALYEELREFEKAADLCRRLDREDAAVELYERAVTQHLQHERYLVAAGILNEKLAKPDDALAILDGAWPHTGQASACLREGFRLRAALGRHEDTQLRLRRLREQTFPPSYLVELVEVLSSLPNSYPDRAVSQFAADTTRVRAAQGLLTGGHPYNERLLKAVERLNPEDRLLARDCQRFAEQGRTRKVFTGRDCPLVLHPVSRINLSNSTFEPAAAVAAGDVIYLVGRRAKQCALMRCHAEGRWETALVEWPAPPKGAEDSCLLALAPAADDFLVVHFLGGAPLPSRQVFFDSPRFPGNLHAGGLPGLNQFVVGVCRPFAGSTWGLCAHREAVLLLNLGREGQVQETRPLDLKRQAEPEFPVPMHVFSKWVYFGLGTQLLCAWKDKEVEVLQAAQPIKRLSGTTHPNRRRLLLGFSQGVEVFDVEGGPQQVLAEAMPNPVAAFIGNGALAVASVTGVEVYRDKEASFVLHAELPEKRGRPLALLPTGKSGRFAVVGADGLIEWFEC